MRKTIKPVKRITKAPVNAKLLASIFQINNEYWLIPNRIKPNGIQIVFGSGFLM
jgi:hypothetical protein